MLLVYISIGLLVVLISLFFIVVLVFEVVFRFI